MQHQQPGEGRGLTATHENNKNMSKNQSNETPTTDRVPPLPTGSGTHLADDVTIGMVVRWINLEHVNAARETPPNMDYMRALQRLGESMESALDDYRRANGSNAQEWDDAIKAAEEWCNISDEEGRSFAIYCFRAGYLSAKRSNTKLKHGETNQDHEH